MGEIGPRNVGSGDPGARTAPLESCANGPWLRNTLAEALVTEGLADDFVAEAFPDTPQQPWDHALSAGQETELWRKAQSVLEIPGGYNHKQWFFGGSDLATGSIQLWVPH
jgi:uncharacterized protein YjaZ